jgi:hypothetical protein
VYNDCHPPWKHIPRNERAIFHLNHGHFIDPGWNQGSGIFHVVGDNNLVLIRLGNSRIRFLIGVGATVQGYSSEEEKG